MHITKFEGCGEFIHSTKVWNIKCHIARIAKRGNRFYLYDRSGSLVGTYSSRALAIRGAKEL